MSHRRIILGIIVILLGLSILLSFPLFNVLVALVIIYFGIRILGGEVSGRNFDFGKTTVEKEDEIKRVVVFGAINKKYQSEDFGGGEIVVVFGAGQIDLSQVKIKNKKIELNLVAVFGELKVKLPKGCAIKTEGIGILGSFNNVSERPSKPQGEILVKGAAIFGAVELA